MYHATDPQYRDSIQTFGLDYRLESRENWRRGRKDYYVRYPPGNYLFDSLEQASNYFAILDRDIWEVNVEGLDLIYDPASMTADEYHRSIFEHSFCALEPIEPERLTLLPHALSAPSWQKSPF